MRKIASILFLLLLAWLGLIFWANRGLFTSSFDPAYWSDKFEHSQWRLPDSQRVLGDDGVYLFEGYELSQGKNPTLFNAEVPPLGKYLIGLSIHLFGNGYVYGYITTALVIAAVFILTQLLTGNVLVSLAAAILTATDPLLVSQFPLTMLDSLQVLFLLLTIFFVMKRPGWLQSAGLGIAFGLFSASKFPVISPIIGIIVLSVLWKKSKYIPLLISFLIFSFAGYLIPYIPYFIEGNSVGAWMSVQKYVVSFYLHGYSPQNIGSLLTALFAGKIHNMFTGIWQSVPEWSPVWPLITAGSLWLPLPIIFILGSFTALYLAVPFWTRYLVTVLPLLYIGTAILIHKKFPKLFIPIVGILMLINAFAATKILFPTPESAITQFTYDWSHGFFQDIYENLAASSKHVPRDTFAKTGQQFFYDGQIESVEISQNASQWDYWNNQQTVPLTITYHTRALGQFTEHTTLTMVREQNRWKAVWDWNNLMAGLTQRSRIAGTVIPATRGSITKNGVTLAHDAPSIMVWITPKNIVTAQENTILTLLHTEFQNRIPAFRIHNRYAQNNLLNEPISIGTIMYPASGQSLAELVRFPGITLTPAIGRFINTVRDQKIGDLENTQFQECCSLLYNTTNYDGASGLEKQFNGTLKGYDGGTLSIIGSDGSVTRTIIDRKPQDGKNVSL